jgi:cystathionine beta-lyase/cystathionine gamma-synthase
MKLESQVVHVGDRKRSPSAAVPSTTPIHLGTTFFYENAETLDRIFGHEEEGLSYARYSAPTNEALEELTTALENGHGSLACASGMAALQIAFQAALLDRPKTVVASRDIYGATIKMLDVVLESAGVDINYVDICDLAKVERIIVEKKPGVVFMESISNPILRVGEIDKIAALARSVSASLIVDSTFATPMLVKPLDLGANIVVHSATKYLGGHGDVLGGVVISDKEHHEAVRMLSRIVGPVLGPFEAYLTMRGIKTLAVRFERQCENACKLASWLSSHPAIDRVYYPADPKHPDSAAIQRQFAKGLYGGILSFEIKGLGRAGVIQFMNRLQMIVPGTSLGDVHTLLLFPVMASHRDVAPGTRQRMGIKDNLVRVSAGIEAVDDIISDLDRALHACRT